MINKSEIFFVELKQAMIMQEVLSWNLRCYFTIDAKKGGKKRGIF